jgi:probable LLM family oxidoreductase
MTAPLEFGLDTFGDVTRDASGAMLPHAQVIRNVVDEAVLADELGLDFIGLGEHHRADFAISSPETVLAAIASRTKRIHLGSAVTVLSSDDPIRVFQRFATLDALSSGRAEVILGRGSFTESFPLFGFDLRAYEALFEEKLDLFTALLSQEPVTWEGKLRPPLKGQLVYPPVENGTLKTWIGVGGSPQSVVRAAHYDLPLMLAIIGGDPARFAPFVDLYHRAFRELGRPAKPIGVHSPGYVAETDERRSLARLQGDARPHRQGARLAADGPRRVRERGRARFALCRLAGDGRAQDREDRKGAGRCAVSAEVFGGPAAA